MRQTKPRGILHQRKINLFAEAENAGHQGIDQTRRNQPDQNQQPLNHPAREYSHQTNTQHCHYGHPTVKRRCRHPSNRNRREIQANRHHHRASNDRRHQAFNPSGAHLHHGNAYQGVDQPAGDNPSECDAQIRVDPLTVKTRGGDHHADKGSARSQIARHAPTGDEEKQQRADARH
ncbi:hypothetical protein D3C85_1085670 [compost metagenome]